MEYSPIYSAALKVLAENYGNILFGFDFFERDELPIY